MGLHGTLAWDSMGLHGTLAWECGGWLQGTEPGLRMGIKGNIFWESMGLWQVTPAISFVGV